MALLVVSRDRSSKLVSFQTGNSSVDDRQTLRENSDYRLNQPRSCMQSTHRFELFGNIWHHLITRAVCVKIWKRNSREFKVIIQVKRKDVHTRVVP